MQAAGVVVDPIGLRRVQLHHAGVVAPEQGLDQAHLVPCRDAVGSADTDMLPAQLVACDDRKRRLTGPGLHAECTVRAVAVIGAVVA